MDEIGYDAEWQLLNSKDFGVPQNRERVFVIGHLRGRSTGEVFPVDGTSTENSIHQLGKVFRPNRDNPNAGRTYGVKGIAPCLGTMEGGNRQPQIAVKIEKVGNVNPSAHGMNGNVYGYNGISPNLTTNNGNVQEVVLNIKEATKKGYDAARIGDSINLAMPDSKTRRGRVGHGTAQTLDTSCNQGTPIILVGDKPNCTDKNNGIYIEMPEGFIVYAIWYEKEQCYIAIRKLTPKECFRLQGWADDYFECAAFVNSDSQLYKQAGNGVTVNVIQAIADKMEGDTN